MYRSYPLIKIADILGNLTDNHCFRERQLNLTNYTPRPLVITFI